MVYPPAAHKFFRNQVVILCDRLELSTEQLIEARRG
jgi:hypothetical protein